MPSIPSLHADVISRLPKKNDGFRPSKKAASAAEGLFLVDDA